MIKLLLLYIPFFFTIFTTSHLVSAQVFVFDLEQLAALDPIHLNIRKEGKRGGQYLEFKPDGRASYFNIWSKNELFRWNHYDHLVLEVEHNEPHAVILSLDFFKTNKEIQQIHSKIGVMPYLRTNVVFPLNYLNNKSIFLPMYPRQLKGMVMGERIEKEEIKKVKIDIAPYVPEKMEPTLRVYKVFLSKSPPSPLSAPGYVTVDDLGQWNMKKWSGKTKNVEAMKRRLLKMEKESNEEIAEKELSPFGGWLKLRFEGTGFFRTHYDGKRWWLVDPEGYAFLSTGVDCVRPALTGPVENMEDLFAPIQNELAAYQDVMYKERGRNTINWIALNYQRVFGNSWITAWEKINAFELKKWKFNTIGNWSDVDFARKIKMPYVLQLENYPTTPVKLYRDFPDVFDSAYHKSAIKFAEQLRNFRDDKYLIGYFLSNEPQWAFGNANLAAEVLKSDHQSFTRKRLVEWLKEKHPSIYDLNDEWGTTFGNFEELLSKPQNELTDKALAQLSDFSNLMIEQYVKPVCDALKKVDPDHLNLGLRYAYISSDQCYVASNYFDVFSINGYADLPPAITSQITQRTGRPVFIGEFHFGSIDLGLPSTGLVGASSVADRGKYIRRYVEQAFSRSEVIGVHYFQWYDQPVMGRFDGENYAIGLYDITAKPIIDVLNMYKKANEKLYKIAIGKRAPYNPELEYFPSISF